MKAFTFMIALSGCATMPNAQRSEEIETAYFKSVQSVTDCMTSVLVTALSVVGSRSPGSLSGICNVIEVANVDK